MTKTIIFVITGLGLGGAEKQLCLLADKLSEHNYKIIIVALSGEVVVTPKNSAIEIINLTMNKNAFGVFNAAKKLAKIIKQTHADVVHSHMFHANIISRLARILCQRNIKLICSAHSKNEGGKARMLAYRLTDSLCDITTNVSGEALSAFIENKAFKVDKSIAVYNGIDTDLFRYNRTTRESLRQELGIKDNDIVILAVGRLTAAKDYPNLLKAFSLMSNTYKLVIIGEGELRSEIERMITELNAENRIMLLGKIMNVEKYYSACDIFVSSSLWEGFGLVVAEAMSSERLVVGTHAGGVAEVVGDMNFIVPVSNPQALSKKIDELTHYEISDRLQIMERNRRFIVDNFSINSIVNKWIDIYFSKQV
jgi:glycosyltransferase involved in cell wall biosynthesis